MPPSGGERKIVKIKVSVRSTYEKDEFYEYSDAPEGFPGEDSLEDVIARHNRMIDEEQGPADKPIGLDDNFEPL